MNFFLNIRRSRKQTIRIEQGDKSTTRVINFGEKSGKTYVTTRVGFNHSAETLTYGENVKLQFHSLRGPPKSNWPV